MTLIDDFEDGDLSEYNGGPDGDGAITNDIAYSGTYCWRVSSEAQAYSTSGLNAYPGRGSKITARFLSEGEDGNAYIAFGGPNVDDHYRVGYHTGFNQLKIEKYKGGSIVSGESATGEVSESFTPDVWYKIEVDYGSSTIDATLYDQYDNEVASASYSDTEYNSKGFGMAGVADSIDNPHIDYATFASAPDAPSNASLSLSGDDTTVTWDDNSSTEDGFHVDRHVDGSWSRVADLDANTTSYSESNLLDGEQYRYRVRAYNSTGPSDWDYTNYATTPLPDPSAGSLTIDSPTSGSVSWTDNSDNEDNFRVQVEEDGSWSTDSTPGSNSTSTTVSFAESTDQIRIRVRAETEHVNSGWTYSSTYSTNVSGLAVDTKHATEVDLSWAGVDQEDGYYVFRAQASGSSEADYTQVADLAAGTSSYTDTGLENGERYYYRVAAYYGSEADALSAEVATTTDLPAAESVALDTSVEDEITVSWTKADNSSDGEWVLYRSTDGSLGSIIADGLALSTTEYTDTGLADGEQYHYTIRRATDHASTDVQQSAVALLPAPTTLTVDAIDGDQATVSWTPNHDNGDQRVEVKPTDSSTWTVDGDAIGRTTSEYTTTNLLDGERYDLRVVAYTDHTETEDA